ncbi:unnamed protein product [Rhodiola kirilowii]
MSLEELVVRLKIEEDNRGSEKRTRFSTERANVAEHGGSSKGKKISNKLGPKTEAFKKKAQPKFAGKCFNCDKEGHRAADCKKPMKKKKKANVVEGDEDLLVAVISQLNLADSNPKEWWLDTGATHYIWKGSVVLKMTSGKELKLTNVSYVPDIRKNLVSRALLDSHGFKLVFESQKVVLSKNGLYMGRGYVKDGTWKLNVIAIKAINKESSSAYLLESSNLWHGRLGHVNYDSISNLMKSECIPKLQIDSQHKCEICGEAKLTRTSFHSVERDTEPLDLIHSDLCDLKFMPTRGGNKYFVTFIDDSSKYCSIYLLKSKDEAIEKFDMYKLEVENQLNKKIKRLRSDRGGEYVEPFGTLCAQNGIIHEVTPPYSPQSNGVDERKNRTIKEIMNAMLLSSGLPQGM